MLDLLESYEMLQKSPEFLNTKGYLAHAFAIIDQGVWQIGYYDPDTDKITPFMVSKSVIDKQPEAEVFKEPGKVVKELDITLVKVALDEALKIVDTLITEKYSGITVFKKMAILQHIGVGQVWNITILTNSFKTLNVKIDAETAEIIGHSFKSIIDSPK